MHLSASAAFLHSLRVTSEAEAISTIKVGHKRGLRREPCHRQWARHWRGCRYMRGNEDQPGWRRCSDTRRLSASHASADSTGPCQPGSSFPAGGRRTLRAGLCRSTSSDRLRRRMVLVPLPVEAAGPGHLLGQKPRPGGSRRGEGHGRTPWLRGWWWLLSQVLLEWMSWAHVGAYAYWECINL